LPQWPEIALEALQVIIDDRRVHGEIRSHTHELIEMLALRGTEEARERLASWFVATASPSEAKLAIRLVQNALDRPDEADHASLSGWCRPLTSWLVDKGAAELARGDSPVVLLHVIETCRATFFDRLVGALSILERSDKADGVFLVDHAADRIMFPAIEAALSRDLPTDWVDQVLGGAYSALNALGCDRFFAALDPAVGMPLLRNALLAALAQGRWTAGLGMEVWKRAFRYAPAGSLAFNEDGLGTALHSLVHARHEQKIGDETLRAWTEVVATASFKRFDLQRPNAAMVPGVWSLDILAAEPRLAAGIARALGRALDASARDGFDDARAVMARAADEPRLASVALLLLPSADASAEVEIESLDDVREVLRSIVRTIHAGPVSGVNVAKLFRGAHEVIIAEPRVPPPDVLIDFSDGAVLTSNTAEYRRIMRKVRKLGTREDALATCALYFVHEAIHVLQGIQRKPHVTALRATGSEHTLAHLDLEADDLAARIVAASTSWSLGYLKNIEGIGAMAFPASMHHTNASVTRKSVRLISLRFDHVIRERGLFDIAPNADGYGSVEIPFGEGEMLVMWNGPAYHRVLGTVWMHAGEAHRLTRVARDARDPIALDEMLDKLLERWQSPSDEQ